MEIAKLFDNILDLPGIEGVCLFGTGGQIYLNRLPSFLTNELFADAQRRILAMYDTMDENFLPSDDYMLRFSERWILLRRTENIVLLVLGGEKANLSSTRMVTNMTLKHLTPAVMEQFTTASASSSSAGKIVTGITTPAVAVAMTKAPIEVPPAPIPALVRGPETNEAPAKAPVRMYRGRPY